MTSIDCDAFNELNRATTALALELPGPVYDDYRRRLDVFLASVQPAAGITLTPEEAARLALWSDVVAVWVDDWDDLDARLAKRFKEASA